MPRVQPIDGSGVAANPGRLQDGPTQLPLEGGRPLRWSRYSNYCQIQILQTLKCANFRICSWNLTINAAETLAKALPLEVEPGGLSVRPWA
jgi:hypothetical protein